MNAKDAWLATLGQLQVQLNRATYDTWLRHAELLGYEDGRFVVTVPNASAKTWLERHLLPAMTETLSRIFRHESEIQVIVWNPIEDEVQALSEVDEPPPLESEALAALNPAYTFEAFVIGDANRYAGLLARALVDGPIGKYSPVLFHGEMGMGKTHLLQAVTREWIKQGYNAIYVTAEEFTTQLVAAIRAQETLAFRDKFRLADALLIDDLQFAEGKESTQNELIAIWDTLRNRQKVIIFSSSRLPCDMLKLSKDARSRFQAGPIATIDAPDPRLRLAVLEAKSTQRGIRLPAEVRDLLAARITSSVRDLESAIEQLYTYTHLTAQPITIPTACMVLKALGSSAVQQVAPLSAVLEATAQHYRLTLDDLASRKRTKIVSHARQLAMYLAREWTDASLPRIGEALGGRDHSTVLHGCARIAALLKTDTTLAADMSAIRGLVHRKDASPQAPIAQHKAVHEAMLVAR